MRILIGGSRGLIGNALVNRLHDVGHQVVRLVRTNPAPDEIWWDPSAGRIHQQDLEGFDVVVHLGGASIGERRWTRAQKERLWTSRVKSTELLSDALASTVDRPAVVLVASAIGYYGDRGEELMAEGADPGVGFMVGLVVQWEAATTSATEAGIRVVNLRSGVVLDAAGGALERQLLLFKTCLGGRLGSGKQFLSWISLHDEVEAIVHLMTDSKLAGPVNLVAPEPVRNAEFTKTLGRVLHRPTLVPGPRWMLVAAVGGEMADEVLLSSTRVSSERLVRDGFRFRDPELEPTLRMMLQPSTEKGNMGRGDTAADSPSSS